MVAVRFFQWLFAVLGLMFVIGPAWRTLETTYYEQDISITCTSTAGSSTLTCDGKESSDDVPETRVVVVLAGVGFLLVATMLAVTAGTSREHLRPLARPGPPMVPAPMGQPMGQPPYGAPAPWPQMPGPQMPGPQMPGPQMPGPQMPAPPGSMGA